MRQPAPGPQRPRRAAVLVAVVVVIVLLSLAGYRYLDWMGAEYRAADTNQQQVVEALQRAVGRAVRGREGYVVIALGTVLACGVVRIEKVENGIGKIVGHVREIEEEVARRGISEFQGRICLPCGQSERAES